jgi:hypothetical protein
MVGVWVSGCCTTRARRTSDLPPPHATAAYLGTSSSTYVPVSGIFSCGNPSPIAALQATTEARMWVWHKTSQGGGSVSGRDHGRDQWRA